MRKDYTIKDDILDELDWDPEVETQDVGVTVHKGAVTLTGHVPSFAMKTAAKNAAKRVDGVRAIADEIEVRFYGAKPGSDEKIAEQIAHMLDWNVSLSDLDATADVRDGWVTLNGNVDWQFQRRKIENLARGLKGVSGVSNRIKVKPRVSTYDVKKRIREALERHAEVEASQIKIDVADGKVVLSGTVESLEEMDRIENAVWAADGVTDIEDNLQVS